MPLVKTMKATLDFNLPEEEKEHLIHLKGPALLQALIILRRRIFFTLDRDKLPSERVKAYREINEILNNEIVSNGLQEFFKTTDV